MHRNVIFTFCVIVYFLVATVGLYNFNPGLYISLLILLGVPTALLVRFSAAPSPIIVTVASFALGLGLLLEGAAHITGLWQFADISGLALFGWLSIDVLIVGILKALFLVFFYELIFDDGVYSLSNARTNLVEFGLFAIGSLVLVSVGYSWFGTLESEGAYYWVATLLLLSSVAMLAIRHALTLRMFDKIAHFVVVAAIPMLCVEFLLVANYFKTVTSSFHLVDIPFSVVALPLGEFLLALTIPAFITVVYELYLDDQV